jgi:hypothetical protein
VLAVLVILAQVQVATESVRLLLDLLRQSVVAAALEQ